MKKRQGGQAIMQIYYSIILKPFLLTKRWKYLITITVIIITSQKKKQTANVTILSYRRPQDTLPSLISEENHKSVDS